MFGDTYHTKYNYGENNLSRYVWKVKILAAIKLSKTFAADRASNLKLLMVVLDFKMDYRLKMLKSIYVECMQCLNEDV